MMIKHLYCKSEINDETYFLNSDIKIIQSGFDDIQFSFYLVDNLFMSEFERENGKLSAR